LAYSQCAGGHYGAGLSRRRRCDDLLAVPRWDRAVGPETGVCLARRAGLANGVQNVVTGRYFGGRHNALEYKVVLAGLGARQTGDLDEARTTTTKTLNPSFTVGSRVTSHVSPG